MSVYYDGQIEVNLISRYLCQQCGIFEAKVLFIIVVNAIIIN